MPSTVGWERNLSKILEIFARKEVEKTKRFSWGGGRWGEGRKRKWNRRGGVKGRGSKTRFKDARKKNQERSATVTKKKGGKAEPPHARGSTSQDEKEKRKWAESLGHF